MVKVDNIAGAAARVVTRTAKGGDASSHHRGSSANRLAGRPASSETRGPPPPAQNPVRSVSDDGLAAEALATKLAARTQKLEDSLKEQASELSKQISGGAQRVEVERDNSSGRFVMTVVDSESGQVLRQFPPESVMKVNERLDELSGMLLAVEA